MAKVAIDKHQELCLNNDVKLAVDRPRNVRWNGAKEQQGYLQFKWSEDSSNPIPRGIRIEVRTKDGRVGNHEDNEVCSSFQACHTRGIQIMKQMMEDMDPFELAR